MRRPRDPAAPERPLLRELCLVARRPGPHCTPGGGRARGRRSACRGAVRPPPAAGSSRGEWVSDSRRPRFSLAPRPCSRGCGGGGVRTQPRPEERRPENRWRGHCSLPGGPCLHDTRRGRLETCATSPGGRCGFQVTSVFSTRWMTDSAQERFGFLRRLPEVEILCLSNSPSV